MNQDLIRRIKSKNIRIYGISGKIGSGKDYVTSNFLRRYLSEEEDINRTLIVALADTLKIVAISQKQVTYPEVYIQKTKESRLCLQLLGTEMGRDKYGKYVWVDALLTQIFLNIERNNITCFFITDVRFMEEVEMINSLGGILIRINAEIRTHNRMLQEAENDKDMYNKIKTHPSETSLDNYEGFHLVYNNEKGNYDDFIKKFSCMMLYHI